MTLTTTNCPSPGLHLTAYANAFDPTNLSANYLGDLASSSSNNTKSMSVEVPANTTIVLMVNENDGGTTANTCEYTLSAAPVISTTSLSTGAVGAAYSQTLNASGGTTWTSTALPAGLSLSPAGVLSGTPTAPGSFPITFTVADGSTPPLTTTGKLTLTVNPAPLAVTPPSTPAVATVGQFFSYTMSATGGVAPYSWAATGLPAGLTINASTGEISGTPQAPTSTPAAVTVRVTDNLGTPVTQALSVAVNPATLLITAPSAPAVATVGQPFSYTMAATGGVAPYVWAATGLPAGLTMNAATGEIAGTPTDVKAVAQAKAALTVTVSVTDNLGAQAAQVLNLTVNAAATTAVTPVPTLSQWALVLLGALAAAMGLNTQRRKLRT